MVAAAAILVGLPAGALAEVVPVTPPAPAPPEAAQALAAAEAALEPDQPATTPGYDATAALNALASAAPSLQGADRARARGLLSRPTDGPADRYGDGFPPSAPVASAQSEHFCVFYVSSAEFADAPELADGDGDDVPDYVEQVLAIAETSYSVEVEPGALGWAAPKPDAAGCGPDPSARVDIYLKQLGTAGLFGYESPDPGQGQVRSKYGYLVIDDDYAFQEFGLDPLDGARATVAHELNHLLQQNYDSFQDVWMFESTAVWAEEQVFPEVDDYLNYVKVFAERPGVPITDRGAADGLKVYGTGVWNHWLSGSGGGFGVGVVRRAWEVSEAVDPPDFAIAAFQRATRDLGGSGFSREFARFVAATPEWRAEEGVFPDAERYPDVQRKHKHALRRGREVGFRLDHTGFRLLDVEAGDGAAIVLRGVAEQGLRAGFALVARDGDPVGGEVVVKRRYLDRGGKARIELGDPGRFERITAVAVNADGRADGTAGAWAYRKDGQRFSLALAP